MTSCERRFDRRVVRRGVDENAMSVFRGGEVNSCSRDCSVLARSLS
jgi:hypothetical protein